MTLEDAQMQIRNTVSDYNLHVRYSRDWHTNQVDCVLIDATCCGDIAIGVFRAIKEEMLEAGLEYRFEIRSPDRLRNLYLSPVLLPEDDVTINKQ